jgi:hypothetical protein
MFGKAMTGAERVRRHRALRRDETIIAQMARFPVPAEGRSASYSYALWRDVQGVRGGLVHKARGIARGAARCRFRGRRYDPNPRFPAGGGRSGPGLDQWFVVTITTRAKP